MAKQSFSKTKKIIIGVLIIGGIIGIAIIPLIFAGGAFLGVYEFIARPFQIAGQSMSPNYKNGQYYLTSIIHQDTKISRGDVVIYKDSAQDKDFIKRVIGLPGDSVMLQKGDVYLNGEKLDEPYVNGTKTYGSQFLKDDATVVVPADSYFMMGDNRSYSEDSRSEGFVPRVSLISKVTTCYHNCN